MYNIIETESIEKIRKLQSIRLIALCNKLYNSVPFYKRQFDKNKVDISQIKGIEDIHKLPFTKKEDLRDNYPFGLFTMPVSKLARIHCSSGSTGKPTVVGYTKNDLEVFSEVTARSLVAAGAKPGMMIQNAYGYGLFTGGLGVHYGAEKMGLTVLPISGGNTAKQIECILDFKPEIITCTPSYAQTLAQVFRERKIDPNEISLKYAVLGAEVWTETIRKDIERGLGVKATNIYGLSEIMGPGVSNEDVNEQSGSYIWEDHFYPEVVNPETAEPLPYGEKGVLIFTTLTKEAMPLIRYWTNDITHIYYDAQGSRTHIKMGPIVGRADDMLTIRGVNVYPTQIEACFSGIPQIIPNYQLEVSREGLMDELKVRVEISDDYLKELDLNNSKNFRTHQKIQETIYTLQHNIKTMVGVRCEIALEKENTVIKSEGGKLNRVVDKRRN